MPLMSARAGVDQGDLSDAFLSRVRTCRQPGGGYERSRPRCVRQYRRSGFPQQRMAQLPQPFMRRDKRILGPPLSSRRKIGRSVGHELQHVEQLRRDLDLVLIAGMVERDQDLVG